MKFTQHGLRPFTINWKKKSFLPLSNSSFFFVNISSEWTRNNVKLDKMRRMHAVNKNGKYPRGKCQQWKNLRRLLRAAFNISHSNNSTNENKNCKACILYICLCVHALYCDFQFHCEYFNKQLSFLFHSQPPPCESALQTTFQNYTILACGWILCVLHCMYKRLVVKCYKNPLKRCD